MNSLTSNKLDNIVNIHSNMLSVKELLNLVNYPINEIYIDKFWDNIENDKWIYIDTEMLKYIGYSDNNIRIGKQKFVNLLNNNCLSKAAANSLGVLSSLSTFKDL